MKAISEKKKTIQKRGAKIVIFVLQLLAALSVYVIMAHPARCHDSSQTCQRKTTCGDPLEGGILSRMVFDYDIIGAGDGANKMQRVEMISDDGAKKWRWQINTKTQMQFTKSGGKVYADLKFSKFPTAPSRTRPTTPGSGGQDQIAGTTPTENCYTCFEIQCHESNPLHAFKSETAMGLGSPTTVPCINSSPATTAARPSRDSTCFGANTQWWTDKGMFTAGPDLKIGDGDGEEKVGYVFMEKPVTTTTQKRQPAGLQQHPEQPEPVPHRQLPRGTRVRRVVRAVRSRGGHRLVAVHQQHRGATWATTTRVFELDISQFQLDEAGSSGGKNQPHHQAGARIHQAAAEPTRRRHQEKQPVHAQKPAGNVAAPRMARVEVPRYLRRANVNLPCCPERRGSHDRDTQRRRMKMKSAMKSMLCPVLFAK